MHTTPLDRRALGLALTRAANASVETILAMPQASARDDA